MTQILILLIMALYDKKEIFEKAKKAIVEQDLTAIAYVVAFLPCGMSTFYEFFPAGSDEMEILRGLINDNKVNLKVKLLKIWNESDNATLQLARFRLLADDDEHRRLNQQYISQESRNINTDVDLDEFEKIRESIKLK